MVFNALVIGCGGTGSEIIKLLKLLKSEITCIDYDRVELSNCNRQFYYTKDDVSKFKAKVLGKKLEVKYINANFKDLKIKYQIYDLVFSCLDNVASRMELNYQFLNNGGKILIDIGVESFSGHIKIVKNNLSCLYCIKDLFSLEPSFSICTSSKGTPEITCANRENILKQIIFKEKESGLSVNQIVKIFNRKLSDYKLFTNNYEVETYYYNIFPNFSIVNSIMASLAFHILFEEKGDYIFYNGSEQIHSNYHKISKDINCFICNRIYSTDRDIL